MKKSFGSSLTRLAIKSIAVAVLLAGCGSSSNNDQGVAFSLLGFNPAANGACQSDIFTNDVVVPISSGATAESDNFADIGIGFCVQLQNFMNTQGIRIDRLILSYDVVGADVNPPNTTVAVGSVLGPVQAENGGSANFVAGIGGAVASTSTLPDGYNVPQFASIPVRGVPVEIRQWLALNRNLLPEPPFNMTITARASGVTTSGQRIMSNEAVLNGIVTIDNPIGPTVDAGGDADVAVAPLIDNPIGPTVDAGGDADVAVGCEGEGCEGFFDFEPPVDACEGEECEGFFDSEPPVDAGGDADVPVPPLIPVAPLIVE